MRSHLALPGHNAQVTRLGGETLGRENRKMHENIGRGGGDERVCPAANPSPNGLSKRTLENV